MRSSVRSAAIASLFLLLGCREILGIEAHALTTGSATASSGNGGQGPCGDDLRVFVTSETWTGDLEAAATLINTGGDPGDVLCENAAAALVGPGTFRAYLSQGGMKPTWIEDAVGPWCLVGTGDFVFQNNFFEEKRTPKLEIHNTEHSQRADSEYLDVWTGMTSDLIPGEDCEHWASGENSYKGVAGKIDKGTYWTDTDVPLDCDQKARLYCFEQAP